MTIKQKLYVSASISIGLISLLFFVLLFFSIKVNKELKRNDIAIEFTTAANDVLIFSQKYSTIRSSRIEKTIEKKFMIIHKTIKNSKDILPLDILDNVFNSLQLAFYKLKEIYKKQRKFKENNIFSEDLERYLFLEESYLTKIYSDAHKIRAIAYRISNESRLKSTQLQKQGNYLVLAFVILLIIIIGSSALWITRSINKPLILLQKSVNTLAKGDLDTKIPKLGKDELGYLSQAFEQMRIKRRTTELKLKKQQEKLIEQGKVLVEQSRHAAMGEMISIIAHQWRQPLSIISSVATSVLLYKEMKILSDEEIEKNMKHINDNAQYLSKTIDDFRDFLKNSRKVSNFNLNDQINSFLNLINASIKANEINIILNLQDNIYLSGYPNELLQCFINIFNNAKDAFETTSKNKYIFISTKKNKDKVEIIFKDNAKGIKGEVLTKIFDPYFTTKHQSIGTGLGLSMTYNLIVKGMKGNIEASNVKYIYENKEYYGAEFKITLPYENSSLEK